MRKGLLLSAAGLLLAGSSTAYGACTPVLKCASLGYKYSSSECSEGGLACPFDTSKYFCAEPCTYTVTKATCDSQCKNVGDKACTKNGTAYYEACGSSKCSSNQKCNNGACYKPVGTSRWCCDYTEGCNSPSNCRDRIGYPDCSDVQASCRASGGTPRFRGCDYGNLPYGISGAYFDCE